MGERPLREVVKGGDHEVYRLTIIPTFGNSISVRMEMGTPRHTIHSFRLDGEGGYNAGTLVESKTVVLSETDSRRLDALLLALTFRRMSTGEDSTQEGKDGDRWVLEGASRGYYHLVDRWSPATHNTEERRLRPLVDLCRFVIDKSSLSVGPSNLGQRILE